MADRLFISDLHLAPERPEIIRLFLGFLDDTARHTRELYILGDFVEYWLGDDDPAPGLQPVFEQLRQLADSGVNIFMMHGNRDFLIGDALADRCGFTLIDDPWCIDANGDKVMLMHGDTLCTDDLEYQKLRVMLRDPAWQQDFLGKPLDERVAMAKALRERSRQETASKAEDIMDVNAEAVAGAFRDAGTRLIIHGHTHRPAIHRLKVDGEAATRVVLGDWYRHGSYLAFDGADDFKLLHYPATDS